MDENTLIEFINSYRNQITELKAYIQEQKKQEINQIEERYENEKKLIEEKYREEIDEYQSVISQQKGEIEHLDNDINLKTRKIGELENNIITKEGELQNKIQELQAKTTEYDFLQNRFNEKTNTIKNLNEELIKKKEEHNKYVKEQSIRIYNKGKYDKVKIDTNEMNEEQKNFAINTTRDALKQYSGLYDRANYVKEQFDNKYGGEWCVIIKLRNSGNSSFYYYDGCYIAFKMGQYFVSIAKTSLGDNSLRLNDKGNYNEVNVFAKQMSEEQKNFAIEKTRNALNMYKDHSECVGYIKKEFDEKYGGEWCVVLRANGYGGSCGSAYGSYIAFIMGEFNVNIFKTSKNDDSIRLFNKGDYDEVSNIDNKMSCDIKNFAIETTRKSLNKYTNHFECANYIKLQFDNKYGDFWSVVLLPRGYGGSSCHFYDNCYISFKMGEFFVFIFKTSKK